jgi:hypothetical protein
MGKVWYCEANPKVTLQPWIAQNCKNSGCEHYREVSDDTLVLLQKV